MGKGGEAQWCKVREGKQPRARPPVLGCFRPQFPETVRTIDYCWVLAASLSGAQSLAVGVGSQWHRRQRGKGEESPTFGEWVGQQEWVRSPTLNPPSPLQGEVRTWCFPPPPFMVPANSPSRQNPAVTGAQWAECSPTGTSTTHLLRQPGSAPAKPLALAGFSPPLPGGVTGALS